MDDLSGLDWSSSNTTGNPGRPPPMNTSSAFSSLRPTPSPHQSGRNTPLSSNGSGNVTAKPPAQKPAQDSFSNLVHFGNSKSTANLSLKEQQERLEAEKRRKEEQKRNLVNQHYGDGQFWDSLGQGQTATPHRTSPAPPAPAAAAAAAAAAPITVEAAAAGGGKKPPPESDDDLFAAFNANTKVDNASHYPPPPNLSDPSAWSQPAPSGNGAFGADDDDPFGLNEFQSKTRPSQATPKVAAEAEEDDFLGDLGKPVEEVRKKKPTPPPRREPSPGKPIEDSSSSSSDSEDEPPARSGDPFDRAVAQLVDYGFSPENARRGLTESGAGLNVQAAANWLLDDAHKQAREKAKSKAGPRASPDPTRTGQAPGHKGPAGAAWMREGGGAERQDADENDFSKTAAAMGTNFLKTANSLWKTGQKRVQQAVADFQQDGDPNQPRWMRSAHEDGPGEKGNRPANFTDEAMMLEPGMRPEKSQTRSNSSGRTASNAPPSRGPSPAAPAPPPSRANAPPKWQRPSNSPIPDPRTRLNKQAIEEQSSQAYVSPARRRKQTPQPPPEQAQQAPPPPPPEEDLLFNSTALPKQPAPAPKQARPSPRPPPPRRTARPIPNVSDAALATSTHHRLEGTAHFKRGDYGAAHISYSSSLSAIPQTHPLAILLLCNRALTALKTGEPRQAVADADAALDLIGPGKGERETVDLGSGGGAESERHRDMRDLYSKALTRKAEALEQMEKWADAGAAWQVCVESGVGGPSALAGRQRCQKALAPKPAAAATRPRPAAAAAAAAPTAARGRPRPTTASKGTGGTNGKSAEAVERLRAANKAAEREGDEKFALTDKVDARIAAWRDGKRDNLRALLSSMDAVLWENSGWKKVGLHELVMANKVKIVYMKAIAKTHPDKIPQDATTEVRMIAGTVFSTLNEAWDKFKAENGL